MDYLFIVNNILTFILSIFGNATLPRKVVDDVIDYFHNFLRNIYIPSLKSDILDILKGQNIQAAAISDIEKCFGRYGNILECVDSEAKIFTLLKRKGLIDLQNFKIGITITKQLVGNKMLLKPEYMYGVCIPLRESLRMFLEIPGLFRQILDYTKKIKRETHIITNVMQGDMWLTKYARKFQNEIVFPLFVFYDDLECGDAFGSHAGANKFGATYTTLANLPPHLASRLQSIIFTNLVYSKDKKDSNNLNVFSDLIKQLNYLRQEGITIKVERCYVKVKFQLVLILGDNLGLNGIFGLVECFNSNYFCRICKATSDEAAKLTKEDKTKLRTKKNYEEDVLLADVSKTGIKERCVFNNVTDYDFLDNVTVDLMHDVLEGVCSYTMKALITTFIFSKTYFTLELLNTRIANFDYGLENSNKPPIITLNRLLHHQDLKMSAAEMLCFVRYFGVIIGDLVPKNDEYWQLYQHLRAIIAIVLSPRVIRSDATRLEVLIDKFNTLYIKFYGALKPKFHFLIHYPRILLNNGPIMNFWGMRFESNHRPVKLNATSTSCKKNLLKTIATKQALKMCEMMHALEWEKDITFSSAIDQERFYFDDEARNKSSKYYKRVNISGIPYYVGSILVLHERNLVLEFGEIVDVVWSENDLYFYINVYEEICFDDHYHAHIVEPKNENRLVRYDDLPIIAPALSVSKNNMQYIITRYGL